MALHPGEKKEKKKKEKERKKEEGKKTQLVSEEKNRRAPSLCSNDVTRMCTLKSMDLVPECGHRLRTIS